jgi:hypothetical protein
MAHSCVVRYREHTAVNAFLLYGYFETRAHVSGSAGLAEGPPAEGSVEECRYFLILAKDLGFADTRTLTAALERVSRLLNAYSSAILTSSAPNS